MEYKPNENATCVLSSTRNFRHGRAEPYPGYECEDWSLPCETYRLNPYKNLTCVDGVYQSRHDQSSRTKWPCVLAFSFLDPEKPKHGHKPTTTQSCPRRTWSFGECKHSVVSLFLHDDHDEASRRERRLQILRIRDWRARHRRRSPGRSKLWDNYEARKKHANQAKK